MQQTVPSRRHAGFVSLLLLSLFWCPASGLSTTKEGLVSVSKVSSAPAGGTTAKAEDQHHIKPLRVDFGVTYKKISFVNRCRSSIIFAIRFAPINVDYFVVLGYFTLRPGATGYVANTQASGFYYSAFTSDLLYSWDGTGEADASSVCVPGPRSCIDTELMTWQPLDSNFNDLPFAFDCSITQPQTVRTASSSSVRLPNPKARSHTRKVPQSVPLPASNGLQTSALAIRLSYKVVAFRNLNCISPIVIAVRFQPILSPSWVNAEDFWVVGSGQIAYVTYTQASSFQYWAKTADNRVSWTGTIAACIPSSETSTCTPVSMRSYPLPATWKDLAINLSCR